MSARTTGERCLSRMRLACFSWGVILSKDSWITDYGCVLQCLTLGAFNDVTVALEVIQSIVKHQCNHLSRSITPVQLLDKMCFIRSNSFIKCTVDYIHHLVIHDVLYSVRHLMNGWDLKYMISPSPNSYVMRIGPFSAKQSKPNNVFEFIFKSKMNIDKYLQWLNPSNNQKIPGSILGKQQ